MNPIFKQIKEKANEAIQIVTDVFIARFEVTMVLYFTGEATAKYLSAVSAASVKIEAVLRIK